MILIPLKKLDGNRACLVCFREATNQIAQPSLEIVPSLVEPPAQNNIEVPWVGDDVEYVVLDDEDHFKPLLSDSSDYVHIAWSNVECVGLEDDLVMDDALGCETFIHAIDLENPTIAVGITFGDGDTFTEAIRQYAIKGEYEIAAPYSDSIRYRGYCKDARCKWWIHALQLQDGRTWSMSRKLLKFESSTPTRAIISVSTPSTLTRSHKRMQGLVEPVQCLTLSPDPVHDK